MECTGQAVRMDQGKKVKKLFESKPEGRRRVRLRWLEDVKRICGR
jgi:hypothetical protein